jgi:plastocyanin
MNPIRYLGVALLFVLGCQAMPTVTRTGDVKDIIIGDNHSLGEMVVSVGDEVRWVNKRTAPVRIVFLDTVSEKQLSCTNNFGGLMTPSNTAKLATNETASVCFRDPGYVRYTVRMESANMTGERNVPGVVKVGGQTTGQVSDPNISRSTGEAGAQITDQKSGLPGSTSTTTTTTTTTPTK